MNKPCLKNSNCKTSSCFPWTKTPNRMQQHCWGLSLRLCQESNLLPTSQQGNNGSVSDCWLPWRPCGFCLFCFWRWTECLLQLLAEVWKNNWYIFSLLECCMHLSFQSKRNVIYILPFLGNMVLTLSNSSQRYPSWILESNKILSKSHTRINSTPGIPSYCWHFSEPEKRDSCFTNENSGYFWNVLNNIIRFYINIITKKTFLHT